MRVPGFFYVSDIPLFKKKATAWANNFPVCCVLDNHSYTNHLYQSQEFLAGVGAESELHAATDNNFDSLKEYWNNKKDWLFGFLTYDLKNEIEKLSSSNFDALNFPALHFFVPEIVIELQDNKVVISSSTEKPEFIFAAIIKTALPSYSTPHYPVHPVNRVSKERYLENVKAIRQHIIEGDVYELNYCQEFYLENYSINPIEVYLRLSETSPAPFGAYYKLNDHYLLCSSPERFLKKEGNKFISQPIKGTIKRGTDLKEDDELKKALKQDIKERAENVMIVDLVRNDLARSCKPGSVNVEELFGIYTYPTLHQMISTVTGEMESRGTAARRQNEQGVPLSAASPLSFGEGPGVRTEEGKDTHFIDAIRNAFPMGSMTGAPKIEAMKLIEHYEDTKRGLFSGSVGYITPEGNFDFNVVIRSLFYNQVNKYLSYSTGGAITYDSIPEKEYEECMLKAKGMMKVLGGS